jgi:hypothetical protein
MALQGQENDGTNIHPLKKLEVESRPNLDRGSVDDVVSCQPHWKAEEVWCSRGGILEQIDLFLWISSSWNGPV